MATEEFPASSQTNPYGAPSVDLLPGLDRAPRPWIAVVLSLVAPGAGHHYAGSRRGAIASAALSVLAFLLFLYFLTLAQSVAVFAASAGFLLALRAGIAAHASRSARRSRRRSSTRSTLLVFALLLGVNQGARALLAKRVGEGFSIPSASMAPALVPGDYVYADSRAYAAVGPARGDICVFLFPDDPKLKLVKRVIGLPGDSIEISGDELRINGTPLPHRPLAAFRLSEKGKPELELAAFEEQLPEGKSYTILRSGDPGPTAPRRWQVPGDAYFVLGDNRGASSDSRVFRNTFVLRAQLIGRVVTRYWSSDPRTGEPRLERIGGIEPDPAAAD